MEDFVDACYSPEIRARKAAYSLNIGHVCLNASCNRFSTVWLLPFTLL